MSHKIKPDLVPLNTREPVGHILSQKNAMSSVGRLALLAKSLQTEL